MSENNSRILVVDDEAGIRQGLEASLRGLGFNVTAARSGEEAVYQLKNSEDISFIITDYKMPGLNGFDVLKEAKKNYPHIPVVLMTGHGSVNHAVSAIQAGADDYLCKPFRLQDLEKVIFKKSNRAEEDEPASGIISENEDFLRLLHKAKRAAKSNAPILIEGPSGTGKELFARQMHDWSARKSKNWVAINCAALPSGLLESELFGYEKGAFTGANERKAGRFEQADGGTLLLDEIGELDPLLQAKLLRVLQEGEVDRIGGRSPLKVDVRIIATTNRNIQDLVQQGKFRDDLYFRLYGVRFDMPSLADRRDDIPLLANEFLRRQSSIQERELCFAEGVLEHIKELSWPGNIRELERAVERAAILSESGVIEVENFEFSAPPKPKIELRSFESAEDEQVNRPIREMERDIILQSLRQHQGNRTHTARSLGMSLRTLRHKLKQYKDEGIVVDPAGQKSLGKKVTTNGLMQSS